MCRIIIGVRELPSGTVTFLFTDIEGSTRLLHELGARYGDALAEHRRVLRKSFVAHRGVEVDTQGEPSSSPSPGRATGSPLHGRPRTCSPRA